MLGGDFVNKKKNIYEDLDIIELENMDDMADIFFESWYDAPKRKSIALVADKELVTYVMDVMMDSDETAVKFIDLTAEPEDCEEYEEWMILIDQDGNLTVKEVEWYGDVTQADVIYISMEGEVSQYCIDYCLDSDKEVHLFGYEGDEDLPEADWCLHECCKDCDRKEDCEDTDDSDDDDMHGFTASKSTGNSTVTYSYYSSEKLSQDDIGKMLKNFGF